MLQDEKVACMRTKSRKNRVLKIGRVEYGWNILIAHEADGQGDR